MLKTNKIKQFFVLIGDIVWLYATLYLTLFVRYRQPVSSQRWSEHLWPFTWIFAVWLVIFYIGKLYDLHLAANNVQFLRRTLNSLSLAGIIAGIFFYLLPGNIAPKTNLVLFIALFAVIFSLWRQTYNWLLGARLPKKNIVIIGYNKQVEELEKELNNKPQLGYKIVAIYKENEGLTADTLPRAIKEKDVNIIIVGVDQDASQEIRDALFACLPLKINYISLPKFYETITGKVPIDVIGQNWFLENLSEGSKTIFDAVKRSYDLAFSITIFAITIAFWPLIALIIKLESRGPVFFRQTRAGANNRPFTMIKFRTMREEGNDRSMTVAGDNRVTAFGNFMRKTRIDEIPQILNIIKGEMSFVGPRPERPEIIINLEKNIPFYRERMLVKPGITGSDQISGEYHSPSLEDSWKKLQYDLFYIKNRSIYLDLSIILKTISTVLSRGGK